MFRVDTGVNLDISADVPTKLDNEPEGQDPFTAFSEGQEIGASDGRPVPQ